MLRWSLNWVQCFVLFCFVFAPSLFALSNLISYSRFWLAHRLVLTRLLSSALLRTRTQAYNRARAFAFLGKSQASAAQLPARIASWHALKCACRMNNVKVITSVSGHVYEAPSSTAASWKHGWLSDLTRTLKRFISPKLAWRRPWLDIF